VFRPLPGATKDADVLLIAAWAHYKRHDAFFRALARLRARGERLKTVLIGYRGDCTREDIVRLAQYHGVADQLELHERLPPEEVNRHLNRVKVNVLWSRREGFNRAIIEGFFAGTPGIMREGFNYGYCYPYINEKTGCFATERDLPEKLLWVIRNQERFAPREWVLEHMNCHKATQIIDETVGRHARQVGERWSGGLAVKVTSLDAMSYWDESERGRFEADYAFLRSMLQRPRCSP
jgi:glycosyltransferase involved in cell wall biosynthesis